MFLPNLNVAIILCRKFAAFNLADFPVDFIKLKQIPYSRFAQYATALHLASHWTGSTLPQRHLAVAVQGEYNSSAVLTNTGPYRCNHDS